MLCIELPQEVKKRSRLYTQISCIPTFWFDKSWCLSQSTKIDQFLSSMEVRSQTLNATGKHWALRKTVRKISYSELYAGDVTAQFVYQVERLTLLQIGKSGDFHLILELLTVIDGSSIQSWCTVFMRPLKTKTYQLLQCRFHAFSPAPATYHTVLDLNMDQSI